MGDSVTARDAAPVHVVNVMFATLPEVRNRMTTTETSWR